jgi:hypothetical protein
MDIRGPNGTPVVFNCFWLMLPEGCVELDGRTGIACGCQQKLGPENRAEILTMDLRTLESAIEVGETAQSNCEGCQQQNESDNC